MTDEQEARFRQIAELPLPPLPDTFDAALHARLNTRLLVVHVAELLFRAFPYACVHFLPTMKGVMDASVSDPTRST